jgi:hypothetical protein
MRLSSLHLTSTCNPGDQTVSPTFVWLELPVSDPFFIPLIIQSSPLKGRRIIPKSHCITFSARPGGRRSRFWFPLLLTSQTLPVSHVSNLAHLPLCRDSDFCVHLLFEASFKNCADDWPPSTPWCPIRTRLLQSLRPFSSSFWVFFIFLVFINLAIRPFPRFRLRPSATPISTFTDFARLQAIFPDLFRYSSNSFNVFGPSNSNESLDLGYSAGAFFQKATTAHQKVAVDHMSGDRCGRWVEV